MTKPESLLLFSTIPWMKWSVCQRYRKEHWVWCSEFFDGNSAGADRPWITKARTSNPKDVYETLLRAQEHDRHNPEIPNRIIGLKDNVVSTWMKAGLIAEQTAQEIYFEIDNAPLTDWRPILLIIPTNAVLDRCEQVAARNRASNGLEWVIKDLRGNEFNWIEFPYA